MSTKEITISNADYAVKADVKIPVDTESKKGIILVHGVMINRKSLSRRSTSLAGYLCHRLNAYVITPDYLGETTYRERRHFPLFSDIIDLSIDHLCDQYQIDDVMGFGHSMGCYVLIEAAQMNKRISHIIQYGGPTGHLIKNRQKSFLNYLIKYLYSFNYTVDLKNLLPIIFDQETHRYLENVMMTDPEYQSETYDFSFNMDMVPDPIEIISGYMERMKQWGKPVLLQFGVHDTLVTNSMKALPDGYRDENILIKHVRGASHVTPCMDTLTNLKKLDSILAFHKQVVKAEAT